MNPILRLSLTAASVDHAIMKLSACLKTASYLDGKKTKRNSSVCVVPGCNDIIYKVTRLVDRVTVCNFFGENKEKNELPIDEPSLVHDDGTGLCKEHYGAWYRYNNFLQKKCKTCDRIIVDVSKARACPEPQVIKQFLKDNTDFSGDISVNNRVCYACYKSHLFTIKLLQSLVSSTDSDLSTIINKIREDTGSH